MTQPTASPEEAKNIHTGGGASIGGDATVERDMIGRDVITGDQINVTIQQIVYTTPPVDLPPSDLLLLNFARPLTTLQRSQIEQALDYRIGKTVHIPAEFQEINEFGPQVVALLDRAGLTPHEWQTLPILVNPPGFALGAVCLLSEMHGRMGHFPAIVRLRPESHSKPQVYVVAEIINLQALRDAARRRGKPPIDLA